LKDKEIYKLLKVVSAVDRLAMAIDRLDSAIKDSSGRIGHLTSTEQKSLDERTISLEAELERVGADYARLRDAVTGVSERLSKSIDSLHKVAEE